MSCCRQVHCAQGKRIPGFQPSAILITLIEMRSRSAGVDSLLCLQGCDGRAGLLAFLSVAHLSKKCRHSRMQSILCDFNDVHVCLLDVLQKLARIQSRNENRRAEEPDWKRLYGRALKGRRIFDGANLVIEKVTAFLEDFVSLLSDLASEMERVLKRLGSSA
eukprot:scpid101105/ scgid4042/ 